MMTPTETLPTEPIRAEHRELLPHLEHLEFAALALPTWDEETATSLLPRFVGFLSGHLIPHAVAEDEHLYPVIDRIAGSAAATATMRADHVEIASRVDAFAASVEEALASWDDGAHRGDLAHQLTGLSAIVGLHFAEEEDVLLPMLDEALTLEDILAIHEHMGHGEHEH
ncbi:MAG: hemerythrin domain-containing protein [Acidimicrobiia bacterium]|nr:hemerythrin domain-containing protein [Acidimicrobiia bacterium]